MSDSKYARHVEVGLPFGIVSFDQFTVEPNDKPWDAPARPWITAYKVTGPRIRGTVRIAPVFDERVIEWGNQSPWEHDWEFLPTGLYVGYGRANYAACEGDLTVWGSPLAEGADVVVKRETKRDFSVRRVVPGIGDEAAPRGVRDKTRELIWALVKVHQENTALVHEKATALLHSERESRVRKLRKEYGGVDEALRKLQARHAALRTRLVFMDDDEAFEFKIDEAAPTATTP
ncbi:hypothetical protein G6W61_10420 [Streptomyces sp. KAI-26]|uniref:hypothetical protein n=1 Tax=Streptomyces sp. KAI-26 TaxID=1169747 RepID=UPI0015873F73|nr:hypothetical protein [Streptomyces sp. KAI-26]NUV86620.1 hypothetical protein [Streptomyces sp. KAI-26]NUW21185.1 hypothetical protein [Streptomyces roseoviolaceus]